MNPILALEYFRSLICNKTEVKINHKFFKIIEFKKPDDSPAL